MKHSEPMWSVVCGTRRNGKQNPSVSMAFKLVVTHIADKTYKGVVLSTGQMVWGLSLYDGGSSPSDIPQVFTHNKYSFLNFSIRYHRLVREDRAVLKTLV